MTYNGWMIPDAERARLLDKFAPRYEVVKASHVTNEIDDQSIPVDAEVVVVGRASQDGVEALVVSVDGTTTRPDGKIFHVTWSLENGRASKESNDMLARVDYEPVEPFPIETRAFLSKGDLYITTPLSRCS